MKKLLTALFALGIMLSANAQKAGDIVILYDNDAHCAIEGYPVLAGLRDSLLRQGCTVAVVSAGDFSFGGPVGAASKGTFVIRMMNAVGYDAAVLGNHEFDYGMEQLRLLEQQLTAPLLCCNLKQNAHPGIIDFCPFVIREYNERRVAFVGVTTPTTLYTSLPTAFQDSDGHYLYNFSAANLAETVQRSVDMAHAAGAEFVVLLSHLGDSDGVPTSVAVMKQVSGVDIVIDGHDHHVLPGRRIADAAGDSLLVTSSGAHFQHIGMAILPGETGRRRDIATRLIPTDSLRLAGCISSAVADTLKAIQAHFEAMGSRVIGSTTHDLIAEEGDIRVVRLRETNLGNLVADAFRMGMRADIGWVNGGGVRANLPAGDITHNQLFAVCPYANRIRTIRTTGQDILDALETAVREYPKAEGCFAQVSGISFTIDSTVPSSVVLDDNGRFLRVDGSRRVGNVRIGSTPLDPLATYTVAGSEYVLLNGGDAIHFPNKEVLNTVEATDLELVERFIQDSLGGIVESPYDSVQGRILFKGK